VSNVSSISAKRTGRARAGLCAGDGVLLHRDLRSDFSGIAMTTTAPAAFDGARRWVGARGFRLASLVLRYAAKLHQQRRISHNSLRAVLSGTRMLERFAAFLVLGHRKKRRQAVQDFRSDRVD
jgi:hypothetical protein